MISRAATLVLMLALASAAASPERAEFFEKRVRPLLVERCYECHGEKKQKGGLRLDSAAGVQAGGDSGPALVPGQPDSSLLIKVVRWEDPDLQMPPKNKLSASEVDALVQWVKDGALDPRTNALRVVASNALSGTNHWAYQPLRRPSPPALKDAGWARNEIDRFVRGRMEAAGVAPAADASPAVLLRRLKFDLVGLPPTPDEMEKFSRDHSPEAVAQVVDELLASPEFGERWGRHWLDVVRFAESVTLRGFVYQHAWRYRDYVIESFNRDLPYDQFLREQIAGDLLPAKNVAEKRRRAVATTFLALGNTNLEEQDKAQLRMDIVDEQLDTIGKAFLAQTIGCARCHDHKFDPIPTRDYYAMAGIFRSTRTVTNANVSGWLELPLPVEEAEERVLAEHEAKLARLQKEIKAAKDEAKLLAGKSAEPKAAKAFTPSVIQASELPGLVVDSAQAKRVGVWKESQHSKHFIGDGYLHDDAAGKGEKTLTFIPELKRAGRYEVRFAYQHSPSRSTAVPVTVFHADGETTVPVNQQDAPVIDGRFVSLGQFRFEGNGFGYVLVANDGTRGHVTADAVQFLPAENAEPASAVATSTNTSRATELATRIKSLEAEHKRLVEQGPRRPLVMSVREETNIEDTYVHIRGSVHNRGATVPRGFLQVATLGAAPTVPQDQSGRREFAEWLVSESNPLTARVMVNRVWHWLFGAGFVRTTDNFGTTGEAPSHPELLDHLATRFMEQGWSVKKLIRDIVLSRTYQLASAPNLSADPDNRLFSRANRRRLDVECVRDAMLAISGSLSAERGGPSFAPGLSADYAFNYAGTRRSVYVPVFRNALPPMFEVFDFADPSMVVGVRNRSTVAPQGLFLMNHPFVREHARLAAQSLLAEHTTEQARLDHLCRAALGRAPSEGEARLARERLRGAANELEAWTDVVHAIFASADFRYVD